MQFQLKSPEGIKLTDRQRQLQSKLNQQFTQASIEVLKNTPSDMGETYRQNVCSQFIVAIGHETEMSCAIPLEMYEEIVTDAYQSALQPISLRNLGFLINVLSHRTADEMGLPVQGFRTKLAAKVKALTEDWTKQAGDACKDLESEYQGYMDMLTKGQSNLLPKELQEAIGA
jgi:hypothetical protein